MQISLFSQLYSTRRQKQVSPPTSPSATPANSFSSSLYAFYKVFYLSFFRDRVPILPANVNSLRSHPEEASWLGSMSKEDLNQEVVDLNLNRGILRGVITFPKNTTSLCRLQKLAQFIENYHWYRKHRVWSVIILILTELVSELIIDLANHTGSSSEQMGWGIPWTQETTTFLRLPICADLSPSAVKKKSLHHVYIFMDPQLNLGSKFSLGRSWALSGRKDVHCRCIMQLSVVVSWKSL